MHPLVRVYTGRVPNSVVQHERDQAATAPAGLATPADTHAAERTRLLAMLANGPERRIAQDIARGLGPDRADMAQALAYRTLLASLSAA